MKKAIYLIIALLIVVQFIPAYLPEVSYDNPKDMLTNNPNITDDVKMILKNSCYNCHSNETNYPWYARVIPISFLVSHDIKDGREELNFSHWENYKKIEKAGILDDISGSVSNGEMPKKIYTLIHRNASLSDAEKKIIVNWADEFAESLFE
ncbi:MAG: heme-binding domain-containing protein [Bacteroidetes bacterium]|nr:heme-binding domain-containing protein [Bacteroidota bacterium]MBL6943005.1 heme-binding domain-containing protein [Bacteroidales bacterium]